MCERNAESIINAKILANHFQELCKEYSPPYREVNSTVSGQKLKSNIDVIRFLSQTEELIKKHKVDAETFKNAIMGIMKKCHLHIEILWFLQVLKVIPLQESISHLEDKNEDKLIEEISSGIWESILGISISSSIFRKEMVLDYIKAVFESPKYDIKNNVYSKLLNLISLNLKQFYKNEENPSERTLDLLVLIDLFNCTNLSYATIQIFFEKMLVTVFEGSSQTIKFIVKKQEKIKNSGKEQKISNLFSITSKYFDLNYMIAIIQNVLLNESKNIDWDFMICFITFVGIHYKDGWSSLKVLSNSLLTKSFKTLDINILFYAFLIARQGCFEKSNNSFSSYLQWFSSTFSSKTKLLNNKKICELFFKFLTDIVPYENSYYLKVHLNRPPWVPADCQWILDNYSSVVKTQLCDLNVSTELGICENMTEKSTTVFDVENVMKHFERTNQILNSVFQASMFSKDYYEKKFLVELLSKFEGKNSVRHKLITKLHSLGKIPNALFRNYKSLEKKNK